MRVVLLVSALLVLLGLPLDSYGQVARTGSRAPEFALKNIRGSYVSITALRGKVIVLNFWASWCPPCRNEMPELETLYIRYRGRGLEVLAVSTDTSESSLREYLSEHPLSFRVLYDKDSSVSKELYGVFSIPTSFLIDRDGMVVRKFYGPQEWTAPDITGKIESLLKGIPGGSKTPNATPTLFFSPRKGSF